MQSLQAFQRLENDIAKLGEPLMVFLGAEGLTGVVPHIHLNANQFRRYLPEGNRLFARVPGKGVLDDLRNLDHGLWQGMLIDDVKAKQPKVYRQWQEHPETVCPPDGESIQMVQERLHRALNKIAKKQKTGSLLKHALRDDQLGNLWESPDDQAWELIDVPAEVKASS